MGTTALNSDGLLVHHGTRDASGQHKLGFERQKGYVEIFDDFVDLEADFVAKYNTLSGTDAQAVKALQTDVPNGVYRLTSGDADGTFAADGEQLTMAVPVNASAGGLVLEARIKCVTNTDTMSCGVGFTDVITLEEPVTISGTTITTTASDFVGFVYDTAQTTDQWYCVGVAADTDATGNAISGTAPSTSYQVLRIEVSSDGNLASFFINGAKVGDLTANAVTSTTDVYATLWVCSTTTTSKSIDVDYWYVGYNRV